MKKLLPVMKFACDCLVAFVMKRDEAFLEPEVSPDTDAETIAASLPERTSENQVPWAGIAAGVAMGLTAATAVAILKKGKKKR